MSRRDCTKPAHENRISIRCRYDGPMELLTLLLWLAFCALLALLSARGRETLLLGLWALLVLPILASLYRLGFAH